MENNGYEKSQTKKEFVENELKRVITSGDIPPQSKLPSGAEIAKKYNVSESTVYQVFDTLAQQGYIRTVPREGVYANDLSEVQKRRVRDNCISFILPNFAGKYPSEILEGAEQTVAKENFHLTIFNSMNDLALERKNFEKALEIGSKGILIFPVTYFIPPYSNYDTFMEVRNTGVPLVFVDNFPLNLHVDYVVSNDYQGFYNLTKYVIGMGHTRIAFWGGPTHISSLRARQRGFLQAMNDSGLKVDPRLVFPNPDNFLEIEGVNTWEKVADISHHYLSNLLQSDYMPTALITIGWDDEHNRLFQKSTLSIPEDLSICTIYGEEESSRVKLYQQTAGFHFQNMTHIVQSSFKLGRVAAQMVLQKIENKNKEVEKIALDMPLYEGDSVRKASNQLLLKEKQ